MNGEEEKLGSSCLAEIRKAARDGQVYVSAISVWEVATLEANGRIVLSMDCRNWVDRALDAPGVRYAELTPPIAVDCARLPENFHGDPADRILVATARALNGTLLTVDRKILQYAARKHVRALNAAK
jgi:PIN domain nuclease of toxin-antitoxin system